MLQSPSVYRQAARNSLAATPKPGKVIFIHTGVILLVSLLLVLVDYFLDQQIASTGGLRDISTRAALATVQFVLRIAQMVLLPFWQIGYSYYTLRVARGEYAGLNDLWEGFRRFFPFLRLQVLMGILLMILMFFCSYAAGFLFMMTPWAAPVVTQMEAMLVEGQDYALIYEALATQMQDALLPLMIIFGVLFAAVALVFTFFFRLSELWLLDHPDKGAFAAMRGSFKGMRGNKLGMLRIDLSFWWFYILEALVCVLSFGDVILGAFGLEMTNDAFLSYLLFFCLYLWGQMALYWWKRNEVSVTYAHAYLALCPDETKDSLTV